MTSQRFVYLDNNATTRVAPEVVQAMLPFFTERWGNPSSAYTFGHQLGEAISKARSQVAALVNAEPREIIFTSCGTESNNSALHSALLSQPGKKHIITSAVEHSATLKYCHFLAGHGYQVTFLPVSSEGLLDLSELKFAIRENTAIVSLMWANNETGVLFPIQEIADICRTRKVLFHTDAVQAAAKVPLDVKDTAVDFLSLSGHKLHAPKGVGALYIRRGVKFQPYLIGGGQERGRRGGTENVANIVGFGKAAELAVARTQNGTPSQTTRALRDRMETTILETVAGAKRNGAVAPRLPNTTNIGFSGIEAEGVLMLLDQAGICASSGSACTTGSLEPSHVLTAMGCTAAQARASLRLSLGDDTCNDDVDYLLKQLPAIIAKLRRFGPI